MNIYAIPRESAIELSVATDGAKAIGNSVYGQSYKKGYEEAQAAKNIQDLDRAKENLIHSQGELSDEDYVYKLYLQNSYSDTIRLVKPLQKQYRMYRLSFFRLVSDKCALNYYHRVL